MTTSASSKMSGETLKPFLVQQNVDSHLVEVRLKPELRQRKCNLLAIILSCLAFVLALTLFGYVTWSSYRLCRLENDVKSLNTLVEGLRKNVAVNFDDDFEKDYTNALIFDGDDDDVDRNGMDDLDEDMNATNENAEPSSNESTLHSSRDSDDFEDYEHIFNSSDDDDNLYDDLRNYMTKRNKAKEESARKARSIIAHNSQKLTSNDTPDSYAENQSHEANKTDAEHEKSTVTVASNTDEAVQQPSTAKPKKNSTPTDAHHRRTFVSDKFDGKISPLRHRTLRNHKLPLAKGGESLISAKTTAGQLRSRHAAPAAHFHLNRKVSERHAAIKVDSYAGDMYIGDPSFTDNTIEHYFKVENGILTVREPGLYYIYAQICYNNTHDQNGFVIFHGHHPFLQCLNTVPTNLPLKIHTCHTSGLIHMRTNETIHLRDFHSDRNVILRDTNNRSYFGIIKI